MTHIASASYRSLTFNAPVILCTSRKNVKVPWLFAWASKNARSFFLLPRFWWMFREYDALGCIYAWKNALSAVSIANLFSQIDPPKMGGWGTYKKRQASIEACRFLEGTNTFEEPFFRPEPKPNRNPAQRLRFGKEAQQNERALTFLQKSKRTICSPQRRVTSKYL